MKIRYPFSKLLWCFCKLNFNLESQLAKIYSGVLGINLLQYKDKPMPEWEEEVVHKRPNGCVCFPKTGRVEKICTQDDERPAAKMGMYFTRWCNASGKL